MQKKLREYDILIFSLSDQKHRFQFEVEDSFFDLFENSIVDKGTLVAQVELEKTTRHLQLDFDIKGKVQLECDRSLDKFDFQIDTKESIIFKYTEEYEEIDENIIHIPFDYQKINVAQFVYDFISVSVPMKKLHPKFKGEEEEATFFTTISEDTEEEDNETNDPRWNELKKLIDKNK